jgi:hypothetical protein
MYSTNLFIIPLVSVFLLITSCKKDSDTPSAKPVRYITEKDTFKTEAILYADTIYVFKAPAEIKGKLTIRPGTLIKLETTAGLIAPTIVAVGTKEQPIIFTSIYDDEHGGDADGDKGVIKPQAGDWLFIGAMNAGVQIHFEFCEFYYGGSVTCITLLNQQIENCTFAHCNGFSPLGTTATLMSLALDPTNAIIANNLFYDNEQPLSIYPGTSIDSTNTFSFNGTGNKQNGIFIYKKELTLKSQLNWQENEVPFVIQKNITIEDGGHLEFMNGTVVKFLPGIEISKAPLNCSLNGGMKNVVYTSFKDDAHGGDTNGDGNASAPHNGDWEGIYGGAITGWWSGNTILYDNH